MLAALFGLYEMPYSHCQSQWDSVQLELEGITRALLRCRRMYSVMYGKTEENKLGPSNKGAKVRRYLGYRPADQLAQVSLLTRQLDGEYTYRVPPRRNLLCARMLLPEIFDAKCGTEKTI